MMPLRLTTGLLLGLLLVAGSGAARAGDQDLDPEVVIHVPADEMDVLLQGEHRGVVLRYDEYMNLLAKARARSAEREGRAPIHVALLRAEGTLDLPTGRIELEYTIEKRVEGAWSVPFFVQGFAIESVTFGGEGRYEEQGGVGYLRLGKAQGARTVKFVGVVRIQEDGARRRASLRVPPAAAVSLDIALPPASAGVIQGEGAQRRFRTAPKEASVLRARPASDGRLSAAWDPAARGEDLPPVIDAALHQAHQVKDDVIASRLVVTVDVLRAPTEAIRLRLPSATIVRAAEGKGVVGATRSEDRRTLTLKLDGKRQGRIGFVLTLETPYEPGPALLLPVVQVEGALRQRSEVGLRAAGGVALRGVTVEGGRRLDARPKKGQPLYLRYALARRDSELRVDVLSEERRVEAASTYYLNLTEPARTLLSVVTYRVHEGELFRIVPRFPVGYALTKLEVNGKRDGFRRDAREDGSVEIRLERGVKSGQQIVVAATLQRAGVDWVPDDGVIPLAFLVPSAGADREDGFLGVGADTSFEVLDDDLTDLVPVGAAALTQRGVSPAGLIYGYRLDGVAPSVRLAVQRKTPRIEAQVVAQARPTPRRLEVVALVRHEVERAGVRRFDVFLPAWAGDSVRVEGADVVAHHEVEDATDVPEGFTRWQVDLGRRVLGRHGLRIRYHEEQEGDDWQIEDGRPLAPRLPVKQTKRMVVVERAEGLQVDTLGDVSIGDLADLPPGFGVDPLRVREIVRLGNGREGPGIAVRKHEGAGVLDAIAARVDLSTAVAYEGILRTRASVRLVNVGLQFLHVALPPGSTLVGAIVEGQPVKPLVDGRGVLRVPIPPSKRGGAQVRAELTYDTRMDGPIGETVHVPAPRFPGLEVLKTRHDVAFDPRLEIQEIAGDFGARQPKAHRHVPWIATALGALVSPLAGRSTMGADAGAPGSSVAAARRPMPQAAEKSAQSYGLFQDEEMEPTVKEEMADHVETDNELPYEESLGEDGISDAPFTGREDRKYRGPANNATPPGMRDPGDAPPPPPSTPSPEPVADPMTEFRPPRIGIEGPGGVPQPAKLPPRPRRKGLLSLDVPVLLSPNRLRGERLGEGGEIVVTVAERDVVTRRHLLFTLAFATIGLIFARGNRRYRIVVPLVFAGLAAAAAVVFGRPSTLLAVALLDAATVLVFLWLFVWVVRKTLLRRPQAAVAALVMIGMGLALFAGSASAERKVYVPYDPNDPGVPRAGDRVYLPLQTWLALRQRAGVKDSGREAVKIHGAAVHAIRHAVQVEGDQARVETVIDLRKYGEASGLLPVPLGKIGVTEALLGGEPVELVQLKGVPHVLLQVEGEQTLRLRYRVPVERDALARRIAWNVPRFAGAVLTLEASGFDGRVVAQGAAHVRDTGPGTAHIKLGPLSTIELRLVEREPTEPDVPLRTRGESTTYHRILDGGTETEIQLALHVLQGEAYHVDVDVPDGIELLDAGGKDVARWETRDGAVRLVFAAPVTKRTDVFVRAIRAAEAPSRSETLPSLALRDTTGESGLVAITTDPLIRVEPVVTTGLLRTRTPSPKTACRYPPPRRVASAWRFAARPTTFGIRTEVQTPSLQIETTQTVVFGEDQIASTIASVVTVDPRRPVGELTLELPGDDRVVHVRTSGLESWWTEGDGDSRTLHIRFEDLRHGNVVLTVRTVLRLSGRRDALLVPRASLRGARSDRGRLVLWSRPDVEIAAGGLPGLRALPLQKVELGPPPAPGATPQLAYAWETPLGTSLPVALGTPALEVEAVIVSAVHPADDQTTVEHLVLFDVRRGQTDRFQLFVPDGGLAADDMVRTSDLREIRPEAAVRRGPNGEDVRGTLYGLSLQTPRRGLVEVTVSQRIQPHAAFRPVRAEGVAATRFFGLVGAFVDGEIHVTARGAEEAAWADMPFLPAGLQATDVVEVVMARQPYMLDIDVERHQLQLEAGALVTSSFADAVLGRDGHLRVQMTWSLLNRREQFLRVRLPAHALLYGTTVAGRPVKPHDGPGGDVLVPVPKVQVGGAAYDVSLLYRAPAGARLPSPELRVDLPEVVGIEVDRTVVRLFAPKDFEYDVETEMIESDQFDATADLAEAKVQEARELLEITKGGTLSQRRLAAESARQMVGQALDLNRRAGQKRGKLNRDLQQTRQQFESQWKSVQVDVARQTRVQAGQQTDSYASNVQQQIAVIDEEQVEFESAQNDLPARSGWFFNGLQAGEGRNKAEVQMLKQRLGKALEQRAPDAPSVQQEASRFLGDTGVDVRGLGQTAAANFRLLNDFLVADQRKNVQLGVQPQGQPGQGAQQGISDAPFSGPSPNGLIQFAGDGDSGLAATVDLDDVTNGLEDAARGSYDAATRTARNPSSGIYFNDGSDGDFRGRTENVFDRALGAGGGAGGAFAPRQSPTRRRGLMGVKVELPKEGKVFYFRSAKAGAPIELHAQAKGTPTWLRWIVFLTLIAAAVALVAGWSRRRARRALRVATA